MKVLVIEDEIPAAEKLERYLHRIDGAIRILAVLKSVKESVQWLKDHPEAAELIFMDIQLVDGRSFEIFEEVNVRSPVIFTTAYDEFAIEAFQNNGIAYLLKPLSMDDLKSAFAKVEVLKERLSPTVDEKADLNDLIAKLKGENKSFKSRFMVKTGDHIRSIPTEIIHVFFAEGRNAYLITSEGRKFIIDYKLEDLEGLLDPIQFMRVNRTFIVNIKAIKDVVVYSNSRLKVVTDQEVDKEIIISREKVGSFKNWIDGK